MAVKDMLRIRTIGPRSAAGSETMGTTAAEGKRDAMGFRHRGERTTRLEAFVDAAFAFSLSLVVIAVGRVPDTREELIGAVGSIPAFAACFGLIAAFWRGHVDWSERFGLDDAHSRNLSLILIFLVLIFVFPLKIVFASFFAWMGGGWLPASFEFKSIDDVRLMFQTFAVAFGSMGVLMWLLNRHAWQQREALGLDAIECDAQRVVLQVWALVPLFALVSLALSLWPAALRYGGPGMIFFLMHGAMAVLRARHRRRLEAALASAAA
jgi:uncharacterized membrane protein